MHSVRANIQRKSARKASTAVKCTKMCTRKTRKIKARAAYSLCGGAMARARAALTLP